MKSFVTKLISAVGRQFSANGKRQSHIYGTAILVITCSFALLGPALVNAQTTGGTVLAMRVNIPFEFTVGDRVLPAGRYTVYAKQNEHELVVRSEKQYVSVRLTALSAFRKDSEVAKGKLEFTDYGDAHILKKVWQAGDNKAAVVPTTKREQELARAGAPVHVASVLSE